MDMDEDVSHNTSAESLLEYIKECCCTHMDMDQQFVYSLLQERLPACQTASILLLSPTLSGHMSVWWSRTKHQKELDACCMKTPVICCCCTTVLIFPVLNMLAWNQGLQYLSLAENTHNNEHHGYMDNAKTWFWFWYVQLQTTDTVQLLDTSPYPKPYGHLQHPRTNQWSVLPETTSA